jgi:hypothetical protein
VTRPALHRLAPLLLFVLLTSCRCAHTSRPPAPWPAQHADCAAPALPHQPWRHTRSELTSRAGEPRHLADDLVVAAGSRPPLHGKLSYGTLSKDLEDETVEVFMSSDGCSTRRLGTTVTDDDGQVAFDGAALPPGFHRYWLVVPGDGTSAEGGIWVVGPSTPAVVFDIDGTLTLDDAELLNDLTGDGAAAYPNAAAVAQAWADKGYLIVYVTGRPYPLRAMTRRWLDARGFPYGPLFTPGHLRSAIPTADGVGAYKRETFTALLARGLRVVRAYGNASTDVCAYAQAGIAPGATFILGASPPDPCAGFPPPHALTGYVGHEVDLAAQPPAR